MIRTTKRFFIAAVILFILLISLTSLYFLVWKKAGAKTFTGAKLVHNTRIIAELQRGIYG